MLNKHFQIILFSLFVFLTIFSFNSVGQNSGVLKKDTAGIITVRTSENIQNYLNDDYYLYDTEQAQSPETLWQKILFWIQQLIYEFFYLLGKGGSLVLYIFYAVVTATLIFIILKLLGVSPHSLFLRTKKIKLQDIPVFQDDINAVDFEKTINDAIKNEDYRKAVRFLYIKFLKILSENEEIEWKKEKTNKDYKTEMKNSKYRSEFLNLTETYEYVWYGEFKIKHKIFKTVFSDFNRIFKDFE